MDRHTDRCIALLETYKHVHMLMHEHVNMYTREPSAYPHVRAGGERATPRALYMCGKVCVQSGAASL